MTIIAYKDEIIACDSKASWNNLYIFDVKKIVKAPNGTIGGGSGSIAWVNLFNNWLLSNRKKLWTNFNNTCSGMFITLDRQVFCVDGSGIIPVILTNNCFAIGSGMDIAFGCYGCRSKC